MAAPVLFYGFTLTAPEITDATGWSDGVVSGAFAVGLLIAGFRAAPIARALARFDPRPGPHHRIDRRHAPDARLRRPPPTRPRCAWRGS